MRNWGGSTGNFRRAWAPGAAVDIGALQRPFADDRGRLDIAGRRSAIDRQDVAETPAQPAGPARQAQTGKQGNQEEGGQAQPLPDQSIQSNWLQSDLQQAGQTPADLTAIQAGIGALDRGAAQHGEQGQRAQRGGFDGKHTEPEAAGGGSLRVVTEKP